MEKNQILKQAVNQLVRNEGNIEKHKLREKHNVHKSNCELL